MCVWKVMADSFDFDDSYIVHLLYQNSSVERFMKAKQSMGISACKGMGKTFLLKAKRMQLQADNSAMEGVLVLPKNQLVDVPSPLILDRTTQKFLESYHNWITLWIGCICIYLLSQEEIRSTFTDRSLSDLNKTTINLINSENLGVYHVLGKILSMRSQEKLRDVAHASNLLLQLMQRINRSVYLFIDKLEEPFDRSFYKLPGSSAAAEGRYNSSTWAYAQLSFADAVYTLYSGRHHIKIFYGIRQEALVGAELITRQDTKIMQELITKLEYSFEDLRKMFEQYVKFEKRQNLLYPDLANSDPVKALCGVSKILHRSGVQEHMWAYIHRHTLHRPRDIMEMGQTLYDTLVRGSGIEKEDEANLARVCRRKINEISSRECRDYIAGLDPFMSSDKNENFTQNILSFLRVLPTNVFTKDTVLSYCHRSNEKEGKIDCTQCSSWHIFSILYNIGLLGRIYKSSSETGYKNEIEPIGNCIFTVNKQMLPDAELYYAHPGLGNLIQQEREASMRTYTPSNFVINSSEVFVDEKQVLTLEHFCAALEGSENNNRVFLSSTGCDLKDVRQRIITYLKDSGYDVVAYEDEDFPSMPSDAGPDQKHQIGETQDHCIDVMLSCKNVIYIFGGRFGGVYHGKKYLHYKEEYSKVIKIRPSISFMEYLVAKKFGKNIDVYVFDAVNIACGEWILNDRPKSYKSQVVDDIRVFTQLGYFNMLGNGTWLHPFPNSIKLESFIKKHFPRISDAIE